MLNSITPSIENDFINGGIRLKSKAKVEDLGNIASIVISRRESSKSEWVKVYAKDIAHVEDLNFDLLDILTLSGITYNYSIDLMSVDSIVPLETEIFENIKSQFYGLLVGNFDKFYVAGTNFKTETKRNMQVEYVTTLAGRYPYRICNAETNYTTGSSSGLFLKLTENKKNFIPDDNNSYSNEVLNFLCDGTSKIIKTHDGQIWYVSIDGNPRKVYSEFLGLNALEFSWTEIGEIPQAGMVVMAGE